MTTVGHTTRGDGLEIPPGAGIIPILKEAGDRQLAVVGTGFFVTRYGLFATAKHVLDELADWTNRTMHPGYVFQDDTGGQIFLRRITGISVSNTADVAIGQADNGVGGDRRPGPSNLRGPLSLTRPDIGEALVTYAYPENKVLEFRNRNRTPTLRGDYFRGVFRSQLDADSRPHIPYPHYETSLEIRSGASGCPIFNSSQRIIGIACRGWDFRGGEHQDDQLSSILPLTQLLPIELGCVRIPTDSWEYRQIPEIRRGTVLTFGELVTHGHVDVGAL